MRFIALGAVFQQVLSMLVVIIVTRSLGVQGYGKMATLIALIGTLYSLSTQWSLPFVLRESSISFSQNCRLGKEFFFPFVISIFILCSLILFIPALPSFLLAGTHTIQYEILVIGSIGFLLIQVAKTGFQIKENFLYYSLLLCADKGFLLILILTSIAFGALSSTFILWLQAASIFFTGLIGVYYVLRWVWWPPQRFLWRTYVKSATPILASMIISNLVCLPFLILHAETLENVAWLGMGNMTLGMLLQPFNWHAPTLAPKLSKNVLANDSKELIQSYLDGQLIPFLLLAMLISIILTSISIHTPILGWIFGTEFIPAAKIISQAAFLAPVEVANIFLIQLVYAKSREYITLPAILVKSLPFLFGLFVGWGSSDMLLALNAGSWLMIAVQAWSIREFLTWKQIRQIVVVAILSFIMQMLLTLHCIWCLNWLMFTFSALLILMLARIVYTNRPTPMNTIK